MDKHEGMATWEMNFHTIGIEFGLGSMVVFFARG
jgi:hypothetical protein